MLVLVKIIYSKSRRYSIQRDLNTDSMIVKLHISHEIDLEALLKLISKELIIKSDCKMEIQYLCPNNIRHDPEVKKRLQRIFSGEKSKPKIQINHLSEILYSHIKKHGNAPNIHRYFLNKNEKKIKNYFQTIIHKELSTPDMISICQDILEMSAKNLEL